jgi:hypothetical protein
MKIVMRDEAFNTNEKRFYVPCSIFSNCPKCGRETERDLEQHYLSYPGFNTVEAVYFGCYEEVEDEDGEWSNAGCNHEWEEQIVLRVTIESASEEDDDE